MSNTKLFSLSSHQGIRIESKLPWLILSSTGAVFHKKSATPAKKNFNYTPILGAMIAALALPFAAYSDVTVEANQNLFTGLVRFKDVNGDAYKL